MGNIEINNSTYEIPELPRAQELVGIFEELDTTTQDTYNDRMVELLERGSGYDNMSAIERANYRGDLQRLIDELNSAVRSPASSPAVTRGTIQEIINILEQRSDANRPHIQDAIRRLSGIDLSDSGGLESSQRRNITQELEELLIFIQDNSDELQRVAVANAVGEVVDLYNGYLEERREITAEAETEALRDIIRQVAGIDINGSATVEELTDEIRNFRARLERGELGRGLLDEERDIIIEQLNQILEGRELAEEIGYDFINDYFDGMAQSIERDGDQFVLDLGDGETRRFPTQQEAADFVLEMKNQAEIHFQSGLRNLLEPSFGRIGRTILRIENGIWLDSPIGISPYELGSQTVDNSIELINDWDWLQAFGTIALALATLASTSVAAGIHSGAFESMNRRIIHDWLRGRVSGSNLMEDYARRQGAQPIDMSSPEGRDFQEGRQRQQIMDLLQSDLERKFNPGSTEYNRYRTQISRIENFKLVRGPTFYYLAYKYGYLRGKNGASTAFTRFAHTMYSFFVRGASFYYPTISRNGSINPRNWNYGLGRLGPVDDSPQLANRLLGVLLENGGLQDGINLFFQNKTVRRENMDHEPPRIVVEGPDDKTPRYQHILDEINARDLSSSEKTRYIERFTNYVDSLLTTPKSIEIIQRDIHFLVNTDYEQRGTLLGEIDRRISEVRPRNNIVSNTQARLRLTEEYRLNQFRRLIQTQEWVGTRAEFDAELENLRNNRAYRVQANYSDRLGSTNFSQEMSNMEARGENIGRQRSTMLGEFFDIDRIGKDFDSSSRAQTTLLRQIIEYIDFGIHDNDIEPFAKREISELFNRIINRSLFFNGEHRLYSEINNIFQGFLPSYRLVDRLQEIVENNRNTPYESDIRNLLERARNGTLNMTPQDIQNLRRNPSGFDYTRNRTRTINPSAGDELRRIIAETAGWSTANFNRTLSIEASLGDNPTVPQYSQALRQKYQGSLDSLRILDVMNGTNRRDNILLQLDAFSHSLESNNYSEGQADDILRRIFAGELFTDIDLINRMSASGDFYNGHADFVSEIETTWDSLAPERQEEVARRLISDPSISHEDITIIGIRNTVSTVLGATEVEQVRSRNIAAMEGFIEDLGGARSPRELEEIRSDFRTFINNSTNNINRSEEPYRTLIADFNSVFEARNEGFRSVPGGGTPGDTPVDPAPERPTAPTIEPEVPEEVRDETSRPGSEYLRIASNLRNGYTAFELEIEMRGISLGGMSVSEYFSTIIGQSYSSREDLFSAMNEKLRTDGYDIQIEAINATRLGEIQQEHLNYRRIVAEDIYIRFQLSQGGEINEMTIGAIRNSNTPMDLIRSIDTASVPEWNSPELAGRITIDESTLRSLRSLRQGTWRNDGGFEWRRILSEIQRAS